MKILVISLAGIGDSLIASPLIEQLRKNFPKSIIDVFVLWKQAEKILEHNPHIDNIFQFNMLKEGYWKSLLYVLKLRKRRYDISINTHPQSKIQYRMVSRLINAKKRLSHLYDNKNILDRFLVNKTLEQDYSKSSIDNNLGLLRLIGINANKELNYKICLSKEDKEKANKFMKENKLKDKKIIGIHAGSGTTKNMRLKRWPLDRYKELINNILKNDKNKKFKILLFGGPEEENENRSIIEKIKDNRVILVKTGSVRETAAIIEKCKIFLSVDNLLMHVASAMQVPRQIVIAGPTYDACIAPKSKPVVISANLNCQPCYRYSGRGINCTNEEKMKCLKDITSDKVYDTIKKVLKRRK